MLDEHRIDIDRKVRVAPKALPKAAESQVRVEASEEEKAALKRVIKEETALKPITEELRLALSPPVSVGKGESRTMLTMNTMLSKGYSQAEAASLAPDPSWILESTKNSKLCLPSAKKSSRNECIGGNMNHWRRRERVSLNFEENDFQDTRNSFAEDANSLRVRSNHGVNIDNGLIEGLLKKGYAGATKSETKVLESRTTIRNNERRRIRLKAVTELQVTQSHQHT